MNIQTLRKRYDMLQMDRKILEQTWQWIENLVVPFRGKFFRDLTSEAEINWNQLQIFDTTAIQACDILSSSMQGSLTSPTVKWFGLQFRDEKLNSDPEARAWTELCENEVFDVLQGSNFNIEASEFYIDLVAFGTAVMSEEVVGDSGVDFSAIPMRECYFEMDHKGGLRNFYRRLQWTPLQIIDKFGRENVPQEIQAKADNAGQQAQEKLEVIFAVYLEEKNQFADVSQDLEASKRPYQFKYFLHKDMTQLGPTGGYYEMPAFIARWRKVSGSQWGHSPAMICLADIRNANELVESTLEAVGKVIDPATITTQRGLISDLDLSRGGLTVVRNMNDIAPFESAARFDVAAGTLEQFRQSIRQCFRIDQLQLKESPAMTATEVQARYDLMQRLLGPTLGRLQNDFLDPLITRTFNLLMRAGRIPKPPEVVMKAQGQMQVEYTGPLPRAQRMELYRSTQDLIMTVGELSAVFPEMLDNIDPDMAVHNLSRLVSAPANILRSKSQVKQLREQRAAAQQQEQDLRLAHAEGEVMQSQGKGEQALKDAQAA